MYGKRTAEEGMDILCERGYGQIKGVYDMKYDRDEWQKRTFCFDLT